MTAISARLFSDVDRERLATIRSRGCKWAYARQEHVGGYIDGAVGWWYFATNPCEPGSAAWAEEDERLRMLGYLPVMGTGEPIGVNGKESS